jgi:hypothetical protein
MGRPRCAVCLPDVRQLAATILKAMRSGPRTGKMRPWTRHIKQEFRKAKPTSPEIVCYFEPWPGKPREPDRVTVAGKKEPQGEYLVDLVWTYQPKPGDEGHRGLLLALECEWNGSEKALWQDFVKLADVTAPRKVFIGALTKVLYEDRERLVHALAEYLHRHMHAQDDIVVIGLCGKGAYEDAYEVWQLGPRGRTKRLHAHPGTST